MTTAVKPKKPVRVVGVTELLCQLTKGYRFEGTPKRPASNFKHTMLETVKICCAGGNLIEIPVGSELVVYRDPHPSKHREKSLKIATFHHPCRTFQTVITSGGFGTLQDLRNNQPVVIRRYRSSSSGRDDSFGA